MKYSPVMIGISGDSGTGKHTIADDIKKFIGNDKVIQINGDDYHKWERGNKNYSYFTHLNPLSNELSKQSEHAFLLKEGKSVFKVEYDHNNGLFTNEKIIDPKNFVIFVGLHSFFHKKMRDILDLKIFLIPDETLRRHWKIIRDMKKRGYSKEKVIENIGARMCDFEKAILPQKEYADCIIEYFPVKDIKELGDGNEKIEIGVKYYVRNDISDIEKLYFEFTEFESIDVELIHVSNEKQILKFIGDISSEVLSKVAQKFVPNIEDLLETNNISWEAGIKGLNQLVFLLLIKDLMVVKKEI